MDNVKRILVISRMTGCCRKTLQYGISLAQKYGAELFVMHVVHNPFGIEGWNLPLPSIEKEYLKELEKTKKDLDALVKSENKAGMSIKELVPEGEPTAEILKAVKRENVDLLILSAHEEGRLEHFLFGRSNEEIIRKMPCSILLVKSQLKAVSF